jgi:hypothetical protein
MGSVDSGVAQVHHVKIFPEIEIIDATNITLLHTIYTTPNYVYHSTNLKSPACFRECAIASIRMHVSPQIKITLLYLGFFLLSEKRGLPANGESRKVSSKANNRSSAVCDLQ